MKKSQIDALKDMRVMLEKLKIFNVIQFYECQRKSIINLKVITIEFSIFELYNYIRANCNMISKRSIIANKFVF